MAAQSVLYEVETDPLQYKIQTNFSLQIFTSNNFGRSDNIIKSSVYNNLNSLAK